MDTLILFGFFGALVWIILQFGIEQALAVGALVSGVVWLVYRLVKGKQKREDLPSYAEYARSFFPIFLVVLLLRAFVAEPFRIPSGSMMPTLLVGDFILVNKFTYGLRMPVTKTKFMEVDEPHRGDVVVFRYPVNPKFDYIKRLIGLPGDHIRYENKTLYINGKPQKLTPVGPYEPVGSGARAAGSVEYIEDLEGVKHSVLINPLAPDFNPGCTFMGYREIVVPEGHYLMMGDNRDDSNDGRCWGFVPEENLVGKAFMIWFSLDWERPGFIAWDRIGNLVH
ncbi:MAG: signal peptidase I [Gammaproteobacteria bacterium]|nr:MAG: signal peptidase I [Gammaproteobacteria bacterium]